MKRYFIASGLMVAVLICFFPFNVIGAEETPQLEQVVVTASRVKEKKKEVTANVTVIGEREIRNSSARDLGELLAEKGIGHIHKYPGTLTSIGIRGFKTDTHGNDMQSHVLILIDGRRAGTGNMAEILTKNVERIEVIRGPGSVQYGSSGMGGVINVITKRGKGKPSGFVVGRLGSFGYEESTVGFSGIVRKFDFSGSYTSATMNDYDTAGGDKYENTAFDSKASTSLNLGFEFLPRNRLGLIYQCFDADHVGSPGYLNSADPDNYVDRRHESLDFIYEGSVANIFWKARYFSGKDIYKWSDPPSFTYAYDESVDQEGAQAQVSLDVESLTLTTGVDWVHYDTRTTSSFSWPKKSEYRNPAYFLLGKLKVLGEKVVVSGGLRYDQYKVEIKSGEGGDKRRHHMGPQFGIAYMLTDFFKVRAHYGEGFMMPSAKQLAGDFTTWSGHYIGNPNLDPERSKTCEIGADIGYKAVSFGVTYFYTKFKDKIETTTTLTGDRTWENVGKARISGVEAELSLDIGEIFTWPLEVRPYASLVYLTKYEDEETDEDLLYTSDANLSYGVTVSDDEGLSLNLNFAYLGPQKIKDWQKAGPPTWTPPIVTKGGFTVANVTITKKILDLQKYGKFTFRGEVRNLFNKDYSYVKGYPMPGRSLYLGLRYDF